MTENKQQNLDQIPESKLSRWAYHLALIPIFGFFLYIPLALFSLIRIGKGKTGLHTLRLGLFRMLRMTTVGFLAVGAWWFCPKYSAEKLGNPEISGGTYDFFIEEEDRVSGISPNIVGLYGRLLVSPTGYGYGYKIRGWSGSYRKFGKWTYYYDVKMNHKQSEGIYKDDKLDGKWVSWLFNGNKYIEQEFNAGKLHGVYIEWSNSKVRRKTQFINGQKHGKETVRWDNTSEDNNYKHGKRHGKQVRKIDFFSEEVTYYENGLLVSKPKEKKND